MEAWSAMLGLLPPLVQRIEAARQPVRDQELQRAVVAGVRACATDIIRDNTLRTWLIGAAVAVSWTAAVGAGVWWWAQSHLTQAITGIQHHLTGTEATGWLTLIENNNLPAVLAAAEKANACGPQNGREACTLPLWLGPLPPPTTALAKP
jgi:hypothetical protein